MSGFTRTHGDSQPVFAIDVQNGPVPSTASANGTPTNLFGPALDFFGMDLGAAPTTQLGVGGAIGAVNQAIEQLATIAIYQVQATANVTNMSVAVYPVGAWTASSLQTAIQALGTVNGYDLTGAAVTNVGFRLASTATNAS